MTLKCHKRVLITGGTGYVGSQLTRRLVHEGLEVHLIVRPNSSTALLEDVKDCLRFHEYDGLMSTLSAIFADSRPEIVFHLASLFLAQHDPEDIRPMVVSNILLPSQLSEAMAKHSVTHLVNTGTSWQHFRNNSPVNFYAATKQAAEAIFDYYIDSADLRMVTLKLFDTYGPGDPRSKIFSLLRQASASGKTLAMSPGYQLIDLVYIDDVISAFLNAAERLQGNLVESKEEYSVTSGRLICLRDLAQIYSTITGKTLRIDWGGRPYREREVMTPWRGGKTLPGWECRMELEAGIRLTEDKEYAR